jgi:hypothetical protein
LDNLRKAEQAAEKAYLARNKDLRDAQAAVADAKTSLDKLSEVINQQGIVEQQLGQLNRDLESKQRDAAAAIEPIKPGDNDIVVRAASDRRPIYAGASGLGMLVLFSSLILWTWHAASREAPYMALAASDLNVMGHGGSRMPVSSNGNGSNGNGFFRTESGRDRRTSPTCGGLRLAKTTSCALIMPTELIPWVCS